MARDKKNPIIYEGEKAEEYKRLRFKWLRLGVTATATPYVLGILVGFFKDTLSLFDMFANGDIILFLFSLTFPMLFDLYDMKRTNDERLAKAFWACVIVIVFQVALYCLIRMDNSQFHTFKSVLSSVLMTIASWKENFYSINAMFLHSISDEGGNDNDE